MVDPPLLKKKKSVSIGGGKLMADAMRVVKPTARLEELVKPNLEGYWSAKYGDKGSLRNESVINDLDEALGQLGEVRESQNKISGSAHVQMGKTELLTVYTRMRAMEADLLQGVADKATIERLEKEIVVANANATSAIALKDAEILKLKKQMDADAKEYEAALEDTEILAGERAYYYGEWIMAYVQLAHPEIDFTDPEFVVPDVDVVLKYRKIPEVKDYIHDYIHKVMNGSAEESKPLVDLEPEDPDKVPLKAGDQSGELITDCTIPQEGVVSVEKETPLEGTSGVKDAKEDAPTDV
ncbi:uncharacterized protein [Euphorbia lathyris]|uniref:uncharacterized protein n=1 Tax=Euphorbia lathyris TaxID=212925 RepID=UPI0033136323